MATRPRIFCDFNGRLGEQTFSLDSIDTRSDLERLGLQLEAGMEVVLYDHDGLETGEDAWIVADSVVVDGGEHGLIARLQGPFRWEPR